MGYRAVSPSLRLVVIYKWLVVAGERKYSETTIPASLEENRRKKGKIYMDIRAVVLV